MPAAIAAVQKENSTSQPDNVARMEDLRTDPHGKILVPENPSDLQLQLCIISYTGPAGHRGCNLTAPALCSKYHWSTVMEDV